MLVLLTEYQVAEDRFRPHYAANRDRAEKYILRQARDPRLRNHGDWHVWEIAMFPDPIPDNVAPWVATVVDHGGDQFTVEWIDTGTQCATAQRARSTYANRSGQ